MDTRDWILAAASWWFSPIGMIGLMARPPLSPPAQRHCFCGLTLHVLAPTLLSADAGILAACLLALLFLFVAISNSVAALLGRDVFFLKVSA